MLNGTHAILNVAQLLLGLVEGLVDELVVSPDGVIFIVVAELGVPDV